ncbi:phage tail spike protein [Lactobacillus helveticus]|uniref:phage tail spike protein n=1 Tax=Lactobacillus helveticus TaxID=1587 RepID=UPI001563C934|nr:phage tail spike protein [Lactobacillus helveticus]NRO57418.1 Chromosome partition protein Smc [Lactobacillus helveticus]
MIFYLLNKNQKVLKAISSNQVIEAHFIEGINQANQLTLSLPLKNRLAPNIFFALCKNPDSTEYLLFKLISEDVQKDRITYKGIDAAYDELKGCGYVKDIRPLKRTAKEILQSILQDTRWEVGYIDSTNPIDTNFYYQPYLECIQQIVQLFHLEVAFTYGFDTKYQEITSRKVNLYLQQGRRTGKRFEYGSNLLEVTREEDSQNIVTALVGRGKGEEKYDDIGEATGGYGRRISFSDVVWSKANGDPVDKPAGQEYIEDPEATKIFGYDDGKPRTGIIVFDDIEDPVELLKATWTSLKSSDHPKVSFRAQVTDVGNLQLGDTIAIIRHEISIEYFTRVFKVDHDLLNENNSTIEMGDDMSDRSLYSYISNVDTTAKQAVQYANQAAVAAGFKNKNYYSTTKPAIADEGDNLFLNLGNGSFEYWIWHNHQWEFIQSTQDLKNVKQNVKEQQAELEKVKKSANDVNSKVDNLHHDTTADIALIKTSLKNAQDDIVNTKNDVQADIVNTKKDIQVDMVNAEKDIQVDIVNTKKDIANAKNDIQANSGRISSVDKRVDGLSVTVGNNTKNISIVTQTANEIKNTVANNTENISTVTQVANGIKSIVANNTENISKVDQKANGIKDAVTINTENISKVDQKANGIKSIVASNTENISAVNQKADGIKDAVTNNTKNISIVTQTANEIKNTVANNTENISAVDQKANEIKSTVANNTENISTITQTANNVSSIVNDKNTGLSAVLQKVDSVSSIINDRDHGLSAVYQKADSLATQIVGKADTSQLIQLSDQIKTKVENKDFASQISQLDNNINLKVSKGNIISQLNIEAGSTLIQNKKLYLDADSVVFSGKAFIPDAAIANISADKINAGTLDAGKINVINLNADNIVAGTLFGKNINMNLVTGRVVFTAGRFYDQKERFDINIDENYVRSSKKTNYIYIGDDSVEKNYTITELKGGEICISRPTLKSDTINGKQVWSFTGRENIFQLTTSEINQSVFGDTSSPVTALVNKNGFVITGDKYITKSNLLSLAGWKDDFLGIVVDTANNTGITVNSGKATLTLCGGKVTTDSWINSQAEIVLGLDPGRIDFDANEANFSGNLTVSGSKNAIVPTSQGMVAINAYETAEYYFGDIGKSKTDKNGQVLIQLDPLFLEAINTSVPYHVFVSPYGNANVWVEQMNRNSFLVKSNKPYIEFSWEIKAKRKGYEDDRLKITSKEIPEALIPQYKEKGIL